MRPIVIIVAIAALLALLLVPILMRHGGDGARDDSVGWATWR